MNENLALSDVCHGDVSPQSKESFSIRGTYHVVCTGPVEEHREKYLKALEAIAHLETLNPLMRYVKRHDLRLARRLLAAIPMEEKWRDRIDNLVPTVGKNLVLDTVLSGSSYTAAWYIGLISSTGYSSPPALADTMASHSSWTEDTAYSASARPTASFASASAGTKSLTAPQTFTMSAGTTIKGCFISSSSSKGGTGGTLLSAGLFVGGDQPVTSGNILNVSYQGTM